MSITQERRQLLEKIETVSLQHFEDLALSVFHFQATHNPLYSKYLSLLKMDISKIKTIAQIPFLPISLFKNYEIKTGNWQAETVFKSSGTTSSTTSQHFVKDANFYKKNTNRGFEYFYDSPKDYCVLALLPAYLERSHSSLVFMAEHFIQQSKFDQSGFFLYNFKELANVLSDCQKQNIPTLIIGVSFALLDLADQFPMPLSNSILMETGGMKGRRKEITRPELHQILKTAFQLENIHSEYGMTELLSQAYSNKNGYFYPAPTMRVLAREITDPLQIQHFGKTGALNIIDLANLDTCSFIATDDLGKVYEDGGFEILGRLDVSDMRGCNLMVE